MQRVRAQRRAPVATGGPARAEPAGGIDRDHEDHDREHVPAGIDVVGAPEEPYRLRDHGEAHEHEHGALAKGREVFGLAVAVGMASVGGPRGDAHAEEGQQRSDQVAGRVQSVGDQGKAVGEQADDQLDPHEQTRRQHGRQGGALQHGEATKAHLARA